MLSERAAWRVIADWYFNIYPSSGAPPGLCFAVDDLLESRMITHQTHELMCDRLSLFRPRERSGGYYWSRTNESLPLRAWACLFLAEMTEEPIW